MNGNIINVTALNTVINAIFRAEEHLHDINVAGEISGFKIAKGHAYFILKDEKCQINCTCFNCAKTYCPKDGESVVIKGSVDYYAQGGKLNLNVDSITAVGQGLLALQLQMLRQKLAKEGLFDKQFKKPIPLYPTNVCVITSFNGAVIKDIKKTVRRKNDIINIIVKDVKVQGKDAHTEIIDALRQVDNLGYDVIIIARGGGSPEELMPFNNEQLVRTVFRCVTPIISAVGHESDVTLCDEAADYRAATPTAAAEKIAYDVAGIKDNLYSCSKRMLKALGDKVSTLEKQVKTNLSALNSRIALNVEQSGNAIATYQNRIGYAIKDVVNEKFNQYNNLLTRLKADNPLGILEKGYWYLSIENKAITSAAQLNAGDILTLRSHDGTATAVVSEVKNDV